MNLSDKFNQKEFSNWVELFLPEFSLDVRKVEITGGFSGVKSIDTLGESSIGIKVFIIETDKDPSGRKIGLAKESFNLIKNYGAPNALIAYYSNESSKWRLSLLTSTAEWSEGKIITRLSNPKRQSYVLGPHSKVNTPNRFLLKKDVVSDIMDLKSRFSLEVVNKEFYKAISESFIKLVGGTLGTGRSQKKYEAVLKLPFIADHSQTSIEFSVRLIGRIIFCWFLREKKSLNVTSLMPKELVSLDAISDHPDYYHNVLEPIFFEVLNQQPKSRKDPFYDKPYSLIPYLNGGLFSPHEDDFYKRNNDDLQSQFFNTVLIPDEWFKELFKTLEAYNFTIDENTSFDEELSIDPEMLGRIFENLLAEINPETGESARKSTGSYYTPRAIVDYMVDESLLLYLKQQTAIEESKLRAIISYDMTDDTLYPLSETEKKKTIDALEKIKLLDPACGSGAFPIGALQKMVFILQQVDPEGQLWFKKQLSNADPEFRRDIERRFTAKEYDYIRKLGLIRKSIYGVDIQPIATEISRLRCFLTLIVDQNVSDELENRGIRSLPNLEFKFVTANTLISLPKREQLQPSLIDNYDQIDELKEIRDQYFDSTGAEREMHKANFYNKQTKIFKDLKREHGWSGFAKAELTDKLTDWDPFSHKASDWFDPEWMFGIKEGFDVVIANPPYIKEYVNKSVFQNLKNSPYYQGKMDYWYMFTCIGIDILKPEVGVLCFIAQNNWPTNYGASKMRNKIILETQIISLVDFTDYKVFDAGVQTMIFVLIKKEQRSNYQATYAKITDKNIGSDLVQTLLNDLASPVTGAVSYMATITPKSLIGKNVVFTNQTNDKILNKIEVKKNFELTEKEVAQGIVAAPDKYFIVRNLSPYTEAERQFIKPFYTSTAKYAFANTNSFIFYLCDKNFRDKKISDYPNINNHFDPFKAILIEAKKKYGTPDKPYFYLHREREEKFFQNGPKVVGQTITAIPSFLYTEERYYGSRAMNFIKTDRINLKYLTGLLNSHLVYFWLKNKGKQLGDLLQIDKGPLLNIPIFKPNEAEQEKISGLVDKVTKLYSEYRSGSEISNKGCTLSIEIDKLENHINQEVYKLYGLSQEEIEIIKG